MRNSSIELLRIVAMFSIVLGHVFYHGFQGQLAESDLLRPFTNCGVNVFILISGYYGIKFKWKTLLDLLLMVSFYTIISGVFRYFIDGTNINIRQLSGIILPFSGNHFYWFITCYIMLYLLAPIINEGIEHLYRQRMLKITPPHINLCKLYRWVAIGK